MIYLSAVPAEFESPSSNVIDKSNSPIEHKIRAASKKSQRCNQPWLMRLIFRPAHHSFTKKVNQNKEKSQEYRDLPQAMNHHDRRSIGRAFGGGCVGHKLPENWKRPSNCKKAHEGTHHKSICGRAAEKLTRNGAHPVRDTFQVSQFNQAPENQ